MREVPAPSEMTPVHLSAAISQSVIPRGGTATVTFTLENRATTDLELTFPSSCQIMPFVTRHDTVIHPPGGDREKEVLQLLAEGRSNKEVATQLNVGLSTIETHRANLMQKLNLHTRPRSCSMRFAKDYRVAANGRIR